MSTKLLLQFNNSFHDGSGNDHVVTTPGYFAFTDLGPFGYGLEPKIGKVDVEDSTDWQIGSGDFTVDFWAKVQSSAGRDQYPFELGDNRELSLRFLDYYGRIYIYMNGSYVYTADNVFVNDTWFHVAFIRSSGVVRLFVNGSQVYEYNNTVDILPQNGFAVGNRISGSYWMGGIAEFRLCDSAETSWWNGFTPPSSPYDGTEAPVIPEDTSGDFTVAFNDNYYAFDRDDEAVEPAFNGCYEFLDGALHKALSIKYGNLRYIDHDGLKLGGDNFTLDFRVKVDSLTDCYILDSAGNSANYIKVRLLTSGSIRIYINSNYFYSPDNILVAGGSYHIALVRTGGLFILYVNGVMAATYFTSPADVNPDGNLYIGSQENNESVFFNGLIENVRFTKNSARWVTDFDASAVAITYPALEKPDRDRDGDFLLHFDDSMVDVSGIMPKLNGCYAYENGTFGKSLRFKFGNIFYENLDSLKLGGDDFTLDFRVKIDSFNNGDFYLFDSNNSYNLRMRFYSSGMIRTYIAGNSYDTASGLIQTGESYHIALTRIGRIFLFYINGELIWSWIFTPTSVNPEGNLYIGSGYYSEYNRLDGTLEEFRIVKGFGIYIEPFTPPAAAHLPAQPDITLQTPSPDFVCHFDDGIFDSSGNNLSVTESGNVAYVDGKFDKAAKYEGSQYAIIGQPSDWQFLNKNVALDCWIKLPADYVPGRYIFDMASQRLSAYVYYNNQLRVYFCGGGYYVENIPTERWFHLAITRIGQCLLIYIDGQLKIAQTNANSIDPTYDFAIGGFYNGSYQFTGQLDELRIYKQAEVFWSEFTPPTSPQEDPEITAAPTVAPRAVSPVGDVYSQQQVFLWTSVYQADRYEFEIVGLEAFEEYPNCSYAKTLPLGSYQWRVRGGNSFGYGPWSVFNNIRVIELVLTNPLLGFTSGWPEIFYMRDGLNIITMRYKPSGVGYDSSEGWTDTSGYYWLAWSAGYECWRLRTPDSDIRENYSEVIFSLAGEDPDGGVVIDYFTSTPRTWFLSHDVTAADRPQLEKTGFSALRAFDWDFGMSEDGDVVTGQTQQEGTGNRIDLWRLKLRKGQSYTFTFKMLDALYMMRFTLYDRDGKTQLNSAYSYNGSEVVINYAPTVTGEFFIAANSYDYGYYGNYSITSNPAPSKGVIAVSSTISDIRSKTALFHAEFYRALRDLIYSARRDCFDIAAVTQATANDKFSVRVFAGKKDMDKISIRALTAIEELAEFNSRASQAGQTSNNSDIFTRSGWEIFCTDTATKQSQLLGFIASDVAVKTLNDVSLPDGVYEISARPCGLLWQGCRSRTITTVTVGEDIQAGLPVIQNLRREISASTFKTTIKWNVSGETSPTLTGFGLWGGALPQQIDVTREPDVFVNYRATSSGEYSFTFTQSYSFYMAVAAMSENDRGKVSVLFFPWVTTPPLSPANQTAQ